MIKRQGGERFAVKLHFLYFQQVDEFAVRKPLRAHGCVQANLPEFSEFAFLGASVAVLIDSRFDHGDIGEA